jgi:XTP/dITP diphosphohydrolase
MQLVVATRNPGKRREFAVLLGDLLPAGTEVIDIAGWPTPVPDVIEDKETFFENAIKKAVETSLATGCTTLADDSGLEVDALDGRPGVYSARYAGEHGGDLANNALVVEELQGVPPEQRSARYVAVLALCLADDELGGSLDPGEPVGDGTKEGVPFRSGDRTVVWFRATCEGRIVDEPRGDRGFGYDPHFFVDDWGQTMAEVSLSKKNERSHRAAAVRKMARHFRR